MRREIAARAAVVNAGITASGLVGWWTMALLLHALGEVCQRGRRRAQARAVPA
jgi:hypothetical protein